MRSLGIDPAIKNLAWSIVEKNENNEDIELCEFGVINLTEPPKCDLCDTPSFYFKFQEIETVYCCEGHKKEMQCNKKIKEKTLPEITETIIKKFDEVLKDLKYDYVCLENQPAFKNPTKKSIEIIILTYFKMKDIKVYIQNGTYKNYGKKFDLKNGRKYRETKKFSVECAKALLDEKSFRKIKYTTSKLDDVCDSINHSVARFFKGKPPSKLKKLMSNVL